MKRYLKYLLASALLLSACGSQAIPHESTNVSVIVRAIESHSQKAIPDFLIEEAKLNCSEIPVTDGESSKVIGYQLQTFPKSWCTLSALNVPVRTDTRGIATLHFQVYPDPEAIGFKPTEGRENNVPLLYWSSEGINGASGMTAADAHNWSAHIAIFER